MTQLTRKECQFKWTTDCQYAFEKLRGLLVSPNIMAYPSDKGNFILDTDASDFCIGAVLSQEQDGKERVIAYRSRTMLKAERNYCVTDKELLAVKHFIEYYKHYLLGRTFVVRSDHQALKWLFSLKDPSNRVARWIEILSAYSFAIEYRPGRQHGNADGMSRCLNPRDCQCPYDSDDPVLKCGPCTKCKKRAIDMQSDLYLNGVSGHSSQENTPTLQPTECIENSESPSVNGDIIRRTVGLTHTPASLRKKQAEDSDIEPILLWKSRTSRPYGPEVTEASPSTRHYWNLWESLELREGVLYRRFHRKDGTGSHLQFVVPKSVRDEILHELHNNALSGHLGRKKCRERALQRFYWHGIREDINVWMAKCDECASIKIQGRKAKAPLGRMIVGGVWDRLGVDILGPLPLTPRGNKYVLVVADYFSKWVEIFPVPDQTAMTCTDKILHEVIARFGCPHDIHTHQGRQFESHTTSHQLRSVG